RFIAPTADLSARVPNNDISNVTPMADKSAVGAINRPQQCSIGTDNHYEQRFIAPNNNYEERYDA
ncbi:MAG: hypothetical protein ABI406_17820, partial [Ktedonobacteraceae bacterium]